MVSGCKIDSTLLIGNPFAPDWQRWGILQNSMWCEFFRMDQGLSVRPPGEGGWSSLPLLKMLLAGQRGKDCWLVPTQSPLGLKKTWKIIEMDGEEGLF